MGRVHPWTWWACWPRRAGFARSRLEVFQLCFEGEDLACAILVAPVLAGTVPGSKCNTRGAILARPRPRSSLDGSREEGFQVVQWAGVDHAFLVVHVGCDADELAAAKDTAATVPVLEPALLELERPAVPGQVGDSFGPQELTRPDCRPLALRVAATGPRPLGQFLGHLDGRRQILGPHFDQGEIQCRGNRYDDAGAPLEPIPRRVADHLTDLEAVRCPDDVLFPLPLDRRAAAPVDQYAGRKNRVGHRQRRRVGDVGRDGREKHSRYGCQAQDGDQGGSFHSITSFGCTSLAAPPAAATWRGCAWSGLFDSVARAVAEPRSPVPNRRDD